MTRLFFSKPAAWLVILILLTLWLSRFLQQPDVPQNGNLQQDMDYIIENVKGIQVDHDLNTSHFFSADKLVHYPEGEITQLEQANLTSLEPGKPLLRISSDHAKLTEGSSDIFLNENVFIIRGADLDKDKVTMLTDFLHLIPDVDIAETDRPVTVIRMNSVVNATGLVLNNRTGEILLQSRVMAKDDRSP